jgi:hypothetical protein
MRFVSVRRIPQAGQPMWSRLVAAAMLSLVVAIATTAQAAAWTVKTTGTYYDPGRVWMTMGAPYGGYAYYTARWEREYLYPSTATGGVAKWRVRKFDAEWVAELGNDCFKRTELRCQDYRLAARVEFLSSSNVVLSSFTLNKLSGPTCVHRLVNPDSRDFRDFRCLPGPFEVSGSATKIRLKFDLAFQRHDGFWFSWPSVTKTVGL